MTLVIMATCGYAGDLDPTNAPGPTMHTLEQIYQKVQHMAPPQSLSPTTTLVQAGYYMATNLTQVDTDLVSSNISTNATIFGVTGTYEGGEQGLIPPVLKTGQTNVYRTGDDGYYQKGNPTDKARFTIDSQTLIDNATGLMWLLDIQGEEGVTWDTAIDICNDLVIAEYSDWRLPNIQEWYSLFELPLPYPVSPLFPGWYYWTSTTGSSATTKAIVAGTRPGTGMEFSKTSSFNGTEPLKVLAIRGGQ